MKHYTKNMILAAAAMAIAAGTVSAQTMKADIPFAFRVGKQVMQPGEYRVGVGYTTGGTQLLKVSNLDSGRSALAVPTTRATPSKAWAKAGVGKLSFTCVEDACSLTQIWSGQGDAYKFNFTHPKDGDQRVSEISMKSDRAE